MREYGEKYIKAYRPSLQQIKLIRAIRLCKSPALGGKVIVCKHCDYRHYIYYSCGHSHCPICQSIKRVQWIDKLQKELYKVPYIHTTFTLPHQLNGVARMNQSKIYSLLMQASWKTIKELSKSDSNIGGLPGMIGVLHTFGSDMKYHIHVHCLITFGGLTNKGQWHYPKHKYKIARYRQLSSTYRNIFLKRLKKMFDKGEINYHLNYESITKGLTNKRWVVHSTRPTMDTKVLEEYLGKYIYRIAISNSRLSYLKEEQKVSIIYNDYKKQQAGHPAPKTLRILDPLVAINQIMQHVLPPYFQKSRRYGLHSTATKKRLQKVIPEAIMRNGKIVKTLFEILTQLLKATPFECEKCHQQEYHIEVVAPDKIWFKRFIERRSGRSPPARFGMSF